MLENMWHNFIHFFVERPQNWPTLLLFYLYVILWIWTLFVNLTFCIVFPPPHFFRFILWQSSFLGGQPFVFRSTLLPWTNLCFEQGQALAYVCVCVSIKCSPQFTSDFCLKLFIIPLLFHVAYGYHVTLRTNTIYITPNDDTSHGTMLRSQFI